MFKKIHERLKERIQDVSRRLATVWRDVHVVNMIYCASAVMRCARAVAVAVTVLYHGSFTYVVACVLL